MWEVSAYTVPFSVLRSNYRPNVVTSQNTNKQICLNETLAWTSSSDNTHNMQYIDDLHSHPGNLGQYCTERNIYNPIFD